MHAIFMSSSPYANAETHNQENWILGQKKLMESHFETPQR